MFYEFIQANAKDSLPCLSVVEKYVASNSLLVEEGVFYFKECREFLLERGLPMKVCLSEDGTGIKPAFQYDLRTNQVVGPTLPLRNGCPVPSSFPATSAAVMANYIINGALAKIAYVVMAQPMQLSAPSFCLVVFGTDNKFLAEDVAMRNDHMVKGLAAEGVEVVAWSSDGDNRCLKAQRAQLFPLNPVIPDNFKSWFCADTSNGPTPFQDTPHLLNRFKTRMMKPSIVLPMGVHVVSLSHLKIVIRQESKAEHGLTEHDLCTKDKMNFTATTKICSERTSNVMKENVPSCDATLPYLDIMRKVHKAFLDVSLLPLERVYNMWYSLFFIRVWRNWVRSSNQCNISDNFITQNMYIGLEINAHGLLKVLRHLRETSHDSLFLVLLLNSQFCERFFGKTRSMTTTESTKVNYTMLDLLHRVKRVEFLLEISQKFDSKLVFPRQ
ncbi:hypothetical protein ONE63_011545 [Megalurothrips usitatus]|uniref:Uncharacterized protein n=1 Tax=Megalurothrips usitatus TaxID=439358 RepID=A0AAV7X593_9NEOP|nr:hypothetical protein ONE63_011545 [Megalurothrips usitatus]